LFWTPSFRARDHCRFDPSVWVVSSIPAKPDTQRPSTPRSTGRSAAFLLTELLPNVRPNYAGSRKRIPKQGGLCGRPLGRHLCCHTIGLAPAWNRFGRVIRLPGGASFRFRAATPLPATPTGRTPPKPLRLFLIAEEESRTDLQCKSGQDELVSDSTLRCACGALPRRARDVRLVVAMRRTPCAKRRGKPKTTGQ